MCYDFKRMFESKAAQIASEEILKIGSADVIPPVQMLQILKVLNERRRQDKKWGEQNHGDYYWMGILVEEVGEAAKALIEGAVTSACPSGKINGVIHSVLQKGDTAELEKEIVHVAAVCIGWLEAITRRRAS